MADWTVENILGAIISATLFLQHKDTHMGIGFKMQCRPGSLLTAIVERVSGSIAGLAKKRHKLNLCRPVAKTSFLPVFAGKNG